MKKKILIGSIIAVALLTLVSFTGVVGYSSMKSDLDISVEENKKEIVTQVESSEDDCGCEDDSSELEWGSPLLCTLLYPLSVIAGVLFLLFHIRLFYDIIWPLGTELNCFWASPEYISKE